MTGFKKFSFLAVIVIVLSYLNKESFADDDDDEELLIPGEDKITAYRGGSVRVNDVIKTIKANTVFTDELVNLIKNKTLKIERQQDYWSKWVFFVGEHVKKPIVVGSDVYTYIRYKARIIDEADEAHFIETFQKTNIDRQGWVGFIKCDLMKKTSKVKKVLGKSKPTPPISVTMVVMACPSPDCAPKPLFNKEMEAELDKYRSELCR